MAARRSAPTATERLVETLGAYAGTARALGASTITLLGTEPIRRAADGGRVVLAVEAGTGLPLYVLSHEEEAWLTLIGVTGGAPVRHETLVVDIGGGSSEFCAVGPRTTARAVGLRIGSQRLTVRVGPANPPSPSDFAALRTQPARPCSRARRSTARRCVSSAGRPPTCSRSRLAAARTRSSPASVLPAPSTHRRDARRDPGRAGRRQPVRATLMAAGAITRRGHPRPIRGRRGDRVRGGPARGRHPGRRPCRERIGGTSSRGSRTAGAPDRAGGPRARRPPARDHAGTPARRGGRHGCPIVRRSRAVSRSRSTR